MASASLYEDADGSVIIRWLFKDTLEMTDWLLVVPASNTSPRLMHESEEVYGVGYRPDSLETDFRALTMQATYDRMEVYESDA